MSKSVVIVSGVRTAIGSFSGALSSLPATQLGAIAIKEALLRANVKGDEVSDVIMGHVLSAAQGQNTARQAAVAAGIPYDKTALTINQVPACVRSRWACKRSVQAMQTLLLLGVRKV